jgi:sugar (pentulose or hexulose) kinase
MHGPVGIDDKGQITTEYVQLWCDKRCQEQCERLHNSHNEAELSQISANPINPAWTGLKALWIKENQPDVYERTKWFLVPKDFVNYKLTGIAATDPSEASGSFLWDADRDKYSEKLANTLGLDLNKFAPAKKSHEIIGTIHSAASKLTDIKEGTPVVAGGGDFPVSLLGFGIVGNRVAADVTGTSTILAIHNHSPIIHPAVQNLRHVVDGWIPFTLLDCGGLSMKWCKELIDSARGQDVTFESLTEMAESIPAGSEGLLFYPYMLGERRPENTQARGGFFGITLNHSASHFVRAVMEGVALAMAKDIELFKSLGVSIDQLYCVGGGARNNLWCRIKADVLQMPLELPEEPEAGIRGAALLGFVGVGLASDLAEAAQRGRQSSERIEPTPDNAQKYRDSLSAFQKVYEHMLGFPQTHQLD